VSNVASFIFSVGVRCFRGKGKATCLAGERPIPENPFFCRTFTDAFLRVVTTPGFVRYSGFVFVKQETEISIRNNIKHLLIFCLCTCHNFLTVAQKNKK